MTRSIPKGIDLTPNDGEFDWYAWQGHIDFGLIPATMNDEADSEFVRNWDMTGQMGLVRFAYHWFNAPTDPAGQAKHFYSTVKEYGLTENDGLVLYVPEYIGMQIDLASFSAYVFCQELEELSGKTPVVYAHHATIDAGYCAKLGEYPLWIISYDTPIPRVPPPWYDWDFWQYASNRVGHDCFNGRLRELDKAAAR